MTPDTAQQRPVADLYWPLRVIESGLLAGALVGLGLFAYSLVDIIRIETDVTAKGQMPPTAWPGIVVFFGSLLLLQVVRTVLHRYRRDDGSSRADALGSAAAATAAVLESTVDESGPAAAPAESEREG